MLVPLYGVMMRMSAESAVGKATDAGWQEASCGVVALVDAVGNMPESRYFRRLPEAGKSGLKSAGGPAGGCDRNLQVRAG